MDDIRKYELYDVPVELKKQCFLLLQIFKSNQNFFNSTPTDTFLEYINCSENTAKSQVNASEKSHTVFSLIRRKFYITGEGENK